MKPNDYSEEKYRENLEKYALYDPKIAIILDNSENTDFDFCYTHLGELNLKFESNGKTIYYHDMDGAINEAKAWSKTVPHQYNHIFLYGLGLGYYYLTIKEWLRKSPNNYFFILEDDIHVLKKFLETNLASEILNDPQVYIQYLNITEGIKSGLYKSLFMIVKGFLRQEFYLTSSKLYSKNKESLILDIKEALFNMTSWNVVRAGEIVNATDLIFGNFYSNTLRQFLTYDGNLLKDAFFGVPAVICGAGPSIVKEISNIKAVNNKAIIIASGTGMNVLNQFGILPHFGTAIDPTDSQTTRIKTNSAFEVPFFYRTRFNKDCFKFVHGPKLLISGKSGYSISEWFTPLISTTHALVNDFKTGISSTNFAMELAKHLGCNPIILLGIDLAYTDASRYPPMISAHPIDTKNAKGEIEQKSEVILGGVGNHGQEVATKIDWITEGRVISEFQKNNIDKIIYNGALEGLSINRIRFKSFSEYIKEFLLNEYDMDGWIHAEYITKNLENTQEICENTYKQWQKSIEKCIHIYSVLLKEIIEIRKGTLNEELIPPYNSKIALLEDDLFDEAAFKFFVADLIEIIDDIAIRQKLFYRCHSEHLSLKEKNLKRLEIDINYIYFLKGHLESANQLIQSIFKDYRDEIISIDKNINPLKDLELTHNYRIDNNHLIIYDKDLDIDINVPFNPTMIPNEFLANKDNKKILLEEFITKDMILNGQYLRFYDDGMIKSECYYQHGRLHGPSKWFNQEGALLSETWFVEGLIQGKAFFYFENGQLHSIRQYKNGKKEGLHSYFYKNGSIKSKLNFKNDLYDGHIEIYYENGLKKREFNFIDGKLDGFERYWNIKGDLIWEVQYKEGYPIEKAKLWNSKGNLIREYTYFSNHKQYNLKEWNEEGKLILDETNITENLQETAEKKQRNIENALKKLNKEIYMIQTLTKEEKKRLFF